MKQISFETAALAYKKKFKLGSFAAYDIDGNITRPYYGIIYKNGDYENGDCVYEAADQEEVLEWLRNEHKCYIVVSPKFCNDIVNWNVQVIFDACNSLDNNGDFLTYEDALEFGLKLALERI
jgi:hypothetical protein